MAVESRVVTVETTPTLLIADGTWSRGMPAGKGRTVLFVRVPADGVVVYIGGEDVSVANGLPLKPDELVWLDRLGVGDSVYAIVGSGTQEVRLLEYE